MVLSGVSKSCRNMAAGAGAAMSRTRSPVKGQQPRKRGHLSLVPAGQEKSSYELRGAMPAGPYVSKAPFLP
jgi:hypothetical protein